MKSDPEESPDDEVLIEGGEQRRIVPGLYDAQVVSYQRTERFNRRLIHFRFRIVEMGPSDGIQLDGFVPLREGGKTGRNSKLARWNGVLCESSGDRRDRVSLRQFLQFLFKVEVRTVERDHQQRTLPSCNRYEVVSEIVAVQAKLGTHV